MKNLISTHSKDFCEKIGPNSPDFENICLNHQIPSTGFQQVAKI
jgi:hypothetical protein